MADQGDTMPNGLRSNQRPLVGYIATLVGAEAGALALAVGFYSLFFYLLFPLLLKAIFGNEEPYGGLAFAPLIVAMYAFVSVAYCVGAGLGAWLALRALRQNCDWGTGIVVVLLLALVTAAVLVMPLDWPHPDYRSVPAVVAIPARFIGVRLGTPRTST